MLEISVDDRKMRTQNEKKRRKKTQLQWLKYYWLILTRQLYFCYNTRTREKI